jgi:hypothetical protein
MPEYEVVVVTIRSGTHSVSVMADDAISARAIVESECAGDNWHCPPEWCTDDVQTEVVAVRMARLQAGLSEHVHGVEIDAA